MSGMRLPKHKKMSMHKLNTYLKPKKVYIPNISIKNSKFSINDKVLMGDVLGLDSKGNKIYSSVSGVVVDFEKVNDISYIVIKNDLKEKNNFKDNEYSSISKKEFISILKENSIVGMGGAGFPTYIKYQADEIDTLIINSVECEPFITSDYALFMKYTNEILDTISLILKINSIKEAIVAVKENNTSLIKKINSYISKYENIKLYLVKDKYPAGWERRLIKEVKGVVYDRLPIEKKIVVNNVSTIYQIGLSLNNSIPLIERVVTFTGDGIKRPCNVKVKVGTKVCDVLDTLGVYKDTIIIQNGPMMGKRADENLIVTPTLNCVLVLKEKKHDRLNICLRCGKCADVCPAGLCPVMIKDNITDIDELRKLQPEKCVECGLCSYVCPSKINVREYIKDAKEKVK